MRLIESSLRIGYRLNQAETHCECLRPYIANDHYMANGLGEWPWRMTIIWQMALANGHYTLRMGLCLRTHIAIAASVHCERVGHCERGSVSMHVANQSDLATVLCESCEYFLAFNFFLSLLCNHLSILENFSFIK